MSPPARPLICLSNGGDRNGMPVPGKVPVTCPPDWMQAFRHHDWGDPIHDFVKLAYFSRAVSIPFAAGQIDGYTGGEVPASFWNKYALYAAMSIIPDVVWSHWYAETAGSPEQVDYMWERVERVSRDHDGFTEDIPRWYRKYRPTAPR